MYEKIETKILLGQFVEIVVQLDTDTESVNRRRSNCAQRTFRSVLQNIHSNWRLVLHQEFLKHRIMVSDI